MTASPLIRLSKSCLGPEEKQAVLGVLDREYLGMGNEVRIFEEMLSEYFGRPAVCVVNGTAALHLALQAAGVGPGDEVLVQSLTYVASYQAISACGATPVSCDVEPGTLTLDWRDAESRITPRTKAVMPVHYAGGIGALDEIYTFARRRGLRVIEDGAHAFGSTHAGRPVGGFGDTACFSFDGIKNITSGEGGCIVSHDAELLRRVRDARLLGVEKDTEKRYRGERSWEFDVTEQGWRYHMSNIMAAIGIEQLKRFHVMADKRQRLAASYRSQLAGHPELILLDHDYATVVPHIFPVLLPPRVERSEVVSYLSSQNIQTGIHYMPNHLLSRYRVQCALPVTDRLYERLLSLPLHYDLEAGEVAYICDNLMRAISA